MVKSPTEVFWACSPAVDAYGHVIMRLIAAHLVQHVQDGGDGVRYAMIWPVDIVQLFQSVAQLEKKKQAYISVLYEHIYHTFPAQCVKVKAEDFFKPAEPFFEMPDIIVHLCSVKAFSLYGCYLVLLR